MNRAHSTPAWYRFLTAIWVAMQCWSAGPAVAATEPSVSTVVHSKARYLVDFVAEDPKLHWLAMAMQEYLHAELARFERWLPMEMPDLSEPPCPGRDFACLAEAHGAAGAEIGILGTVDSTGTKLRYAVVPTWLGVSISEGTVSLEPGTELLRVRQTFLTALQPVLRAGGVLEQRDSRELATHLEADSTLSNTAWLPILLGAAIVLLWLPHLIFFVSAGPEGRTRLRDRGAWVWPAIFSAFLLAVLACVTAWQELPEDWRRHEWTWVAMASGLGWGGVLAGIGRFVFTPLGGFENAGPPHIPGLIRAWTYVMFMRAGIVTCGAVGVAVGIAVLRNLAFPNASDGFVIMAATPVLVGFLAVFLGAVVDVCALLLDGMISPAMDHRGDLLRSYFRSYAQRMGTQVPARILARTYFFVGEVPDGVSAYGGGFSPPRIVVDQRWFEVAFGAVAKRRFTMGAWMSFEQWLDGCASPQRKATRGSEHRYGRRPLFGSVAAADTVGIRASLLGWILPAAQSSTAPKRRPTGVQGHYAALDMHLSAGGDDSSDRTQRDFLFGPLLQRFGSILRFDTVPATFFLAFARFSQGWRPLRVTIDFVHGLYFRYASRYPMVLADAFAVLNHARDHLIQYLHLLRTGQNDYLTARASQPELEATSRHLLGCVLKENPDPHRYRASPENRLRLLAQYDPDVQSREDKPSILRRAVLGVALVACLVLVGVEVAKAWRYRGVYAERRAAFEASLIRDEAKRDGMHEQIERSP